MGALLNLVLMPIIRERWASGTTSLSAPSDSCLCDISLSPASGMLNTSPPYTIPTSSLSTSPSFSSPSFSLLSTMNSFMKTPLDSQSSSTPTPFLDFFSNTCQQSVIPRWQHSLSRPWFGCFCQWFVGYYHSFWVDRFIAMGELCPLSPSSFPSTSSASQLLFVLIQPHCCQIYGLREWFVQEQCVHSM